MIAVGGNALQRRGERLTIEHMLKAAADMAPTIKSLADEHEVVLTHGEFHMECQKWHMGHGAVRC